MAHAFCVKCGSRLEKGSKFCTYCGAPVDSASVPAPSAGHVCDPPAYEPPNHACGEKKSWWPWGKGKGHKPAPTLGHPIPPVGPVPGYPVSPIPPVGPVPGYVGGRDERTTVLPEGPLGDDEGTTVLTPTFSVELERTGTGEVLSVSLPCVVGKGTAATCKVGGNTAISRRHIRLFSDVEPPAMDRLFVEDLGSLNKTKVDGEPLEPGTRRAVGDGTRLTLADESFVLRVRDRLPVR